MIKKILLTSLIVLLAGGLLGSYFFFVGREAAKEITEQGVCLEEYLGKVHVAESSEEDS